MIKIYHKLWVFRMRLLPVVGIRKGFEVIWVKRLTGFGHVGIKERTLTREKEMHKHLESREYCVHTLKKNIMFTCTVYPFHILFSPDFGGGNWLCFFLCRPLLGSDNFALFSPPVFLSSYKYLDFSFLTFSL